MTRPPNAGPADVDIALREQALSPGTRLEDFEIHHVIAASEVAVVYHATDHALELPVAIKEHLPTAIAMRGADGVELELRDAGYEDIWARAQQSFVNEARLLARCDHPSLARVHRIWEANGTVYRAMPSYDAKDLQAVRQGMDEPPDEDSLRTLLDGVLGALDVLHKQGDLHRGVAPDQILLLPDERPVLMGFGAVRRTLATAALPASTLASAPSYVPIEHYAESPHLTPGPWTDIFSLAAVIHYCLSGELPPPLSLLAGLARREPLAGVVARLRHTRPHLRYSPSFVHAVDAALSAQPKDRPQSVPQFRAMLGGRTQVAPVRADAAPVAARTVRSSPGEASVAQPSMPNLTAKTSPTPHHAELAPPPTVTSPLGDVTVPMPVPMPMPMPVSPTDDVPVKRPPAVPPTRNVPVPSAQAPVPPSPAPRSVQGPAHPAAQLRPASQSRPTPQPPLAAEALPSSQPRPSPQPRPAPLPQMRQPAPAAAHAHAPVSSRAPAGRPASAMPPSRPAQAPHPAHVGAIPYPAADVRRTPTAPDLPRRMAPDATAADVDAPLRGENHRPGPTVPADLDDVMAYIAREAASGGGAPPQGPEDPDQVPTPARRNDRAWRWAAIGGIALVVVAVGVEVWKSQADSMARSGPATVLADAPGKQASPRMANGMGVGVGVDDAPGRDANSSAPLSRISARDALAEADAALAASPPVDVDVPPASPTAPAAAPIRPVTPSAPAATINRRASESAVETVTLTPRASAPAPAPTPAASAPRPAAPAAPRQAAANPPAERTAQADAPGRTAPARAPNNPRDVCGDRTQFSLYRCMQNQCDQRQWAEHPQCIRFRVFDEVE
jgi:serine/threonine protein kinase